MNEVITAHRIVDGVVIPRSVANSIHLYLLSGDDIRDIVDALDRERIFFFLRYLLEKHFGRLYLVKAKILLSSRNVVIDISDIVTRDRHYIVKGRAILDPVHALIRLSIEVVGAMPCSVPTRKLIDDNIVDVDSDGTITVKYYV